MKDHTTHPFNGLSYYGLSLLSFLHESHPDKLSDTGFIQFRADLAAQSYSDAIKEGLSIDNAEELASETLYRGLHFSKYDTLVQVLENEFFWLSQQRDIKDYALNLLEKCEIIFQKYELTDDFASTHQYDHLYTELTGLIDFIMTGDELQ